MKYKIIFAVYLPSKRLNCSNSFSVVEGSSKMFKQFIDVWTELPNISGAQFEAGCLISNTFKSFQLNDHLSSTMQELCKIVTLFTTFTRGLKLQNVTLCVSSISSHFQDYYHTEDTQNYGEGGVGHYNRWLWSDFEYQQNGFYASVLLLVSPFQSKISLQICLYSKLKFCSIILGTFRDKFSQNKGNWLEWKL